VAYVVDPVRGDEGVFAWRNSKPALLPHFWGGEAIRSTGGDNGARGREPHRGDAKSSGTCVAAPAKAPESSYFGILALVLAGLLLFIAGFLYSGWRSEWERQMLMEGVIAHF